VNPFEAGARKVIPAVLVYVLDDAGRVLMLHRTASRAPGATPDYHAGKWNGLGGKLELDESPLEAARREVREESGLELPESAFRVIGTLQFPNFKAHKGEDWLCFVLLAELPAGVAPDQALERGPEGDLHWVPARDLTSLNLWPGDRHFIPYVQRREPFVGTIWYRGPEVVRHWVVALTGAAMGQPRGR
jgi:8-oxo-dGTP diphosphatase